MTGVFDRLRAWFGSVFDGGAADGDSVDGAETDAEVPAAEVVHRDDRPLETPSTMDRTDPPASASTEGARVDRPDTEEGTAAADESTPTPETVSIPDAEADAATGGEPATTDDPPNDDGTPSTATGTAADDGDNAAFTCSVCGTTVGDPTEPCPLCRSTDVVPAGETSDVGAPKRSGRTAVSMDDDDEAVDRLRDVTDEG